MSALSKALVVVAVIILPLGVSSARAQSPSSQPWVGVLKEKIVGHVCQDGGKWVECYDKRADDCPRIARDFAYPCIDRAAKTAPQQMDDATASELSREMVECFNKSFQTNYGAWLKNSPECLKPPKHLQ